LKELQGILASLDTQALGCLASLDTQELAEFPASVDILVRLEPAGLADILAPSVLPASADIQAFQVSLATLE
jgi:hypothetical protein